MMLLGCSFDASKNSSDFNTSFRVDNSFEEFFLIFSTDSAFQAERIAYPLYYYFDEDSTKVDRGDWRYVNFADDSLAAQFNHDAYSISFIKKDSVSIDYVKSGIDNGILIIYSFEKEGSRWWLTKVTDDSI